MSLKRAGPRPRRVFMTTDAVGGVWSYTLDLARGLAERGVETSIAVIGPEPTPSQIERASAIAGKVRHYPLSLDWLAQNPEDLARTASELMALAAQSNAELAHIHAPALAGTLPWPMPLVATMHSCVASWWAAVRDGPLPEDLSWRARATATGIDTADAVIAPSGTFADAVRRCYSASVPVRPVLNGRRRPATPRSPPERQIVSTAGRLWDPAKGIATVDAAAARLSTPIIAAGPLRGPNGETYRLRHLRHAGELGSEEIVDFYARTSIFVSMSRYEPFGLAVLEAAHAGAALVLSDIEAFRELWDSAALFVPPRDCGALANAIECLRADAELRTDLASLAQERAGHYGIDAMVTGTLGVYADAMRRAPAKPAAACA